MFDLGSLATLLPDACCAYVSAGVGVSEIEGTLQKGHMSVLASPNTGGEQCVCTARSLPLGSCVCTAFFREEAGGVSAEGVHQMHTRRRARSITHTHTHIGEFGLGSARVREGLLALQSLTLSAALVRSDALADLSLPLDAHVDVTFCACTFAHVVTHS